jgi:hypothetical protein
MVWSIDFGVAASNSFNGNFFTDVSTTLKTFAAAVAVDVSTGDVYMAHRGASGTHVPAGKHVSGLSMVKATCGSNGCGLITKFSSTGHTALDVMTLQVSQSGWQRLKTATSP